MKHKIRETKLDKEYWNTLKYIMLSAQGWALIIMYYVPLLKEIGLSNKDITTHFKELLEAHIGEQNYCSKEVQKTK